MDTALSYYKQAWAEVSKNLVSWIVIYTVVFGVSMLTCGLGAILAPNTYREMKRCVDEDRAPNVGALFDFSNLANDAINCIIYIGAISLGSMLGGIGGSIAAVVLAFMMPLAADNDWDPLSNAKLSLKHVAAHPEVHIILVVIGSLLMFPAMLLCFLPLPLILPVVAMAGYLYYRDSRLALEELAEQYGIKRISV